MRQVDTYKQPPGRPKRSVLILYAHPYPHRSRVNRYLIDRVRQLAGVTVNDLYQHYPHFHIDIGREQRLLRAADVVVFHHPVYWYSAPALLQQWQEEVLEYGFAYGKGGDALHGKTLLSVVTTGHSEGAYSPQGADGCGVTDMLRPFAQTAHHCGMDYLPPWPVYAAHKLNREEVAGWCEAYCLRIQELIDG